ncbi:MAG: lipoprotein [gamma proteobacterium symbiont of Bathyaustriella thionipta]|nr:lipoprotein [gamma proteobacterium symbiont of Bathyaustriella thionipta]
MKKPLFMILALALLSACQSNQDRP